MGLHQLSWVKKGHTILFTNIEQVVFNIWHPTIKTDFALYKETQGLPFQPDKYDYSISIYDKKELKRNRRTKALNMLNASLDNIAIGPFVLLLSLILATPVNWKRKAAYFLIGLLMTYTLIALKYTKLFADNIESLTPGGLWGLLSRLYGDALTSHEFILINVLFFWAIISIRKKEINWLLN